MVPVTLELADRVAGLAPVPGSKVFLTSGGSDSIDTATKMARHYWQLVGETDRTILIRREKAYHGMHTAGTSLAGIPANAAGHGSLIEDVIEVPWDDPDSLRAAIEDVGQDRVAAFFCEPVIGAGGVYPPPDGYLEAVRQVCRDTDVLFVADEVITGFGRCGDWFASTRFGMEPDILVCAKGITSGYLPLGAVLASPRVVEPFWAEGAGMWRHGYTYSGHAAVAAAALVNIDILEHEDLPARSKAMEGSLVDALKQLTDHDLVEDVRGGVGLLAAVHDLVEDIRGGVGLLAAVAFARIWSKPIRAGCARRRGDTGGGRPGPSPGRRRARGEPSAHARGLTAPGDRGRHPRRPRRGRLAQQNAPSGTSCRRRTSSAPPDCRS